MKPCADTPQSLLRPAASEGGVHVPCYLSQFPGGASEEGEVVLAPVEKFAVSGSLRSRALQADVPAAEGSEVAVCPFFPAVELLWSSTVQHTVQNDYPLFSVGRRVEAVGYWLVAAVCSHVVSGIFVCHVLRFNFWRLEGEWLYYLVAVVENPHQRSSPSDEAVCFLLGSCVLTASCPVQHFSRGVALLYRDFLKSFPHLFHVLLEFADDFSVSGIEGIQGALHDVLQGGWAVS